MTLPSRLPSKSNMRTERCLHRMHIGDLFLDLLPDLQSPEVVPILNSPFGKKLSIRVKHLYSSVRWIGHIDLIGFGINSRDGSRSSNWPSPLPLLPQTDSSRPSGLNLTIRVRPWSTT